MLHTNKIRSISGYKIYNSHVAPTNEFEIILEDGLSGLGSSPLGETISIYEDQALPIEPSVIIGNIVKDGFTGRAITQEEFDTYLTGNVASFGRNNVHALSLAFHNAGHKNTLGGSSGNRSNGKAKMPRICFNVLNGGWHAYTNPVLSDFPEYILVAKNENYEETIDQHNEIQQAVREKLLKQPKTVIAGNPVNSFATRDNRECLDFLLNICEQTGTTGQFDLMIDASGTDLWNENGYHLAITNQASYTSEAFLSYWLDIIKDYKLGFLEDPFYEHDKPNWQKITTSQQVCKIIGDNFYASSAERIQEGAERNYTHGVIIKPNQAGTVTAVKKAMETAQAAGQVVITSHRSISTESVFLSEFTCEQGVPYIKIGPLLTDYSSVVRLNAMIRIIQGEKNE